MSERFAIVTDSAADMGAHAQANQVTVVPLTIRFGNEEFRDGVDLTSAEFYARLTSSTQTPVTSQPTPATFVDTYRRLLQDGAERILSLHISGALSGTYNAASLAASTLDPERITVIDTRTVSAGIALLAIEARRRFAAGETFDEVVAAAHADAPRVELFATVPSLTYIARGGRIGNLRGLVGNVLKIVPILTLKDGEVSEFAKVRTFERAVEQLVRTVIDRIPEKSRARVAVLHCVAPEVAATIGRRLREAIAPASEITCDIGPTVGTHAGPGAAGVCFIP